MSEIIGGPPRPPRAIVRRNRPTVGRQPHAVPRPAASGGVIDFGVRRGRPWWRALVPGTNVIWLGSFVLVMAALGLAGGWAWQSDTFRVQRVVVTGAERVPIETIADAAGLRGTHLLTADTRGAARRIAAHPLLLDVAVTRDWPHTIRITVRERQPWGTWEQGGVRYGIDREGVILGTTALPGEGAPLIRSAEPGSRVPGDRVDYQAIQATAELYEQLPRALGTAVVEVAFTPSRGVQVTTADLQVAIFGDSSSIPYKLAVWAAMAEEARRQRIPYTTIDLRFGNRPVLQ